MINQKSISLDEKLWLEIDNRRGDIPRSRFIATILTESIKFCKNTTHEKCSRRGGTN